MEPVLELRPFQREALLALKDPTHLICVAPTGSGKSLIYERTAANPGIRAVLVSPLIALARQQKQRLERLQVPVTLAAGPEPENPPPGQSGVWIVSPERMKHVRSQRLLAGWKPNFLIVDECHCFWDWGEGFRPAFLDLPALLRSFGIRRSLWLTATLPWSAREELRRLIDEPLREIGGFALPPQLSLSIERVPWPDRVIRLMDWLETRNDPGIIFVQTRETANRLANLIQSSGRSCVQYHAGLASEERRNTEAMIERRVPDVIIATSAFGMGMNHPHIRWTLLWQAPPSLLALAQSIGRASRDSRYASEARVFWDLEDFHLLAWMAQGSERRRSELTLTRDFFLKEGCHGHRLKEYFDRNTALTLCRQCSFCASFLALTDLDNSRVLH